MKLNKQAKLIIAAALLTLFAIWTILIKTVDVQAIGPNNSSVGFAAINGFIHSLTGINMSIYTITDWLGLVPLCFIAGFAVSGLIQWIKRRNILKVDKDILALGVFYIIVLTAYFLFEKFIINYRPVLIDGYLEPSYPSSTTLLVLCVIPTAIMQFNRRMSDKNKRLIINIPLAVFTAFMVIGRLISGVHWFTDIIGGILLSAGLVVLYSVFLTEP